MKNHKLMPMQKPDQAVTNLTFKILAPLAGGKTRKGNAIAVASAEKPFRPSPITHFFNLVPLLENFNRAHKTHLKIISPLAAHNLLTAENWPMLQKELCPEGAGRDFYFPVNVLVAYESPGKPLGERIAFNPEFYLYPNGVPLNLRKDLCAIFPVPRKCRGMPNVALAIADFSSRDFKLEGQNYIIRVPEKRIVPIEGFPTYHKGSYKHHPTLVLPYGEDTYSDDGLSAYRFTHGPYIGPAMRMVGTEFEMELRLLALELDWSVDMNLVVEMPRKDVETLSKSGFIAGGRI